MSKTFLSSNKHDQILMYNQINDLNLDQDIKEKALLKLNRKIKELGFDKDRDFDFFIYEVNKLKKIQHNQERIGIENYEAGVQILPQIIGSIAKKIAQENPQLNNIDSASLNLSDIIKLYGKKITQAEIDTINNRYKLKDHSDMEDLMNLSTQDLKSFRDIIAHHKDNVIENPREHYEVKRCCHLLNKVIEKHNLEHQQSIEAIPILINLNKPKIPKLPPIQVQQEKHISLVDTPSSSRSTIVSTFSAKSFSSSSTEQLYCSEVVTTTCSIKVPITPPQSSKPSFKRPTKC